MKLSREQLLAEIANLQARMRQTEEALRALGSGAVNKEQRVQAIKLQYAIQEIVATHKTISWEDLNRAQAVAQTGCWRLDLGQNELLWSEETHRIFGIPPEVPMSYETFLAIIHPEDREYVDRQWLAALEGEPYDIEHRIVVGGSVKWVRERAELEFDSQGQLLGAFGTVQDITDRKGTEAALRQSEARLQLALESANAGIWQWDPQTNNDIWSNELWKLYGLQPNSFKPSYDTWRQTVYPADLPEVEHKLQEAASKGTKFNAEWRTYIPDGVERWIMARGRPYLDANGQISSYLGISLDITERKQAEQELRESKERLHLLANQLLTSQEQERKRLALELHDELGHALLILKFSLRDIAQKLPPEQKEFKYLLQEQLEYIKHVIQKVRRLYSDLSPGDLENLGLTRALKGLIKDFASHLPDITWQVDLPNLAGRFSLPVQTMIYRLLQEALTNIGKHAEPSQVSILAREENGRLCMVIEDDGHGFDLSKVDRDPARGLGLAAMRERLHIVGGFLEIRSQKRQGTRLTFTIPTLPKGA